MSVDYYAVCETCKQYTPLGQCYPMVSFMPWESTLAIGRWFRNEDKPHYEMIHGAVNLQAFVFHHNGHVIGLYRIINGGMIAGILRS